MNDPAGRLMRPRYVIAVQDLARSSAFYRDVLGFSVYEMGDPGWRWFQRDSCARPAVRPLAAGLAELAGVFVRYDTAQEEIARFGFTYIVRKGDRGWRTVVAVAHDAQGHQEVQA